uniref:Uncharacterized protein n=1 Tax=Arion vulgaris TaxID=1028688 RepID=A0A0B6YUL4_9EUPU
MIKRIRTGQSMFFGHIMRKGGMEHLVTTDKIQGRRDYGRKMEMLDALTSWFNKKDQHKN